MCTEKTTFEPPPKILTLPHDEVHIWRINDNLATPPIETLLRFLTHDEREKAERFYFQKDRRQSIIARAALRDILSRYLHVRPGDLRFRYGPQGKPELEQGMPGEQLEFNLSHSHELILAAVCVGRRIGIDVEYMRPSTDWALIVDRFFSPFEIAALWAVPGHLRTEAFFHGWTRKEAYIKAKGGGLSIKLDGFDVSLAPGEPARLLRSVNEPDAPFRWWLKEIFPAPGYAGAVAVEGRGCQLRYCDWTWQEETSATAKLSN